MSEIKHKMDLKQLYDFYVKLVLILAPPSGDNPSSSETFASIIEKRREAKRKLLQIALKTSVEMKVKDRLPGYISELLDENIGKCTRDWNQSKWIDLFGHFEEYAWNLIQFSWKKEYQTILVYSGFFKAHIERHFPVNAERMFAHLGYTYDKDIHKLCLTKLPNLDILQKVSFDCFRVQLEMRHQFDIVCSVTEEVTANGAVEVYKARKKIGGNAEVCIDYMRQHFHEISRANSSSSNTGNHSGLSHNSLQVRKNSQVLIQDETQKFRPSYSPTIPSQDLDYDVVPKTVSIARSSNYNDKMTAMSHTQNPKDRPRIAMDQTDFAHLEQQDETLTLQRTRVSDSTAVPEMPYLEDKFSSGVQYKCEINLLADDDFEIKKQSRTGNLLQISDLDTSSGEIIQSLRLEHSESGRQTWGSKSRQPTAETGTPADRFNSTRPYESVKLNGGSMKGSNSKSNCRSLIPKAMPISNLACAAGGPDIDTDGPGMCQQPRDRPEDVAAPRIAEGFKVRQPTTRVTDEDSVDYVGPLTAPLQSSSSRSSMRSPEVVPYQAANLMPIQRNQTNLQSKILASPNRAVVLPISKNTQHQDVQSLNDTAVKSVSARSTEPIVPSMTSHRATGFGGGSNDHRSQTEPVISRGRLLSEEMLGTNDEQWQCQRCTFLNRATNIVCEICECRRA